MSSMTVLQFKQAIYFYYQKVYLSQKVQEERRESNCLSTSLLSYNRQSWMYKFEVEKDQQQSTILRTAKGQNQVIVRATRIQPAHLYELQNNLQLQFVIHENPETSSRWTALEHNLKLHFEDLAAAQLLPTCGLKTHVFLLSQDKEIESTIFNSIWLCFLLHGVPMKRSVYHHQWDCSPLKGQAVFDLHNPRAPLSCTSNCPPPEDSLSACKDFKAAILQFLKKEWSK